jgi:hypothetical protein
MTLLGFQQALAALIANPTLSRAASESSKAALAAFDLSPRERRRLLAMSAARGMRTSCTLHRANRLTPLARLLPLTFAALGVELRREVHLFWAQHPTTDLHFDGELARFAAFLQSRMAEGALPLPGVEALLWLEMARWELRIYEPAVDTGSAVDRPNLHPRVRVIPFDRDPDLVLRHASAGRSIPADTPMGEHYLLLDGRSDPLRLVRIDRFSGRQLHALGCGHELPDTVLAGLHRAGLITGIRFSAITPSCDVPSAQSDYQRS